MEIDWEKGLEEGSMTATSIKIAAPFKLRLLAAERAGEPVRVGRDGEKYYIARILIAERAYIGQHLPHLFNRKRFVPGRHGVDTLSNYAK